MGNELNSFMKKTIKDLENNIHYKNDLQFVKIKFIEIFRAYNNHIIKLNNQIIKLKNEVSKENILDIKCPYCNSNVRIKNDVNVNEVTCPSCFNLIEIGWSEFKG